MKNKIRKYCPSNGSEGDWFTHEYCMNCLHCNPDPEGKKQCDILMRSMLYNVDDARYPNQWRYNEKDEPVCTEHVKWDWGNDGDPDDPDNPKAPMPEDPNQLALPFILEEIETKTLNQNEIRTT